ncbi:MAG: GNAT family N-acetyltransferase [Hyphomonadaceae bacterium]
MAFLRREGEETGRIAGANVFLRYPEARDFAAWSALRAESRAFLQPWEPTWPEDELSIASFRYKLRRYAHDIRDGKAFPFFVFRTADAALVGGATLSQVRRGAAQAATLGYWVGAPFQGRGYTTDATIAVTRFAFEELDLHRVEAACQPENAPSRRVLAKAGFEEEGRARAYLKINGAWRDHVLFGKVREG